MPASLSRAGSWDSSRSPQVPARDGWSFRRQGQDGSFHIQNEGRGLDGKATLAFVAEVALVEGGQFIGQVDECLGERVDLGTEW
jgi:hypothetical protein